MNRTVLHHGNDFTVLPEGADAEAYRIMRRVLDTAHRYCRSGQCRPDLAVAEIREALREPAPRPLSAAQADWDDLRR